MRATCRLTAALLFALIALAGCDDDKPAPAKPQVWSSAAASLESAILSASGTAPDDLWVVGADAGAGGMVARFNGTAWERLNSGQRYDLWWVQALDASHVYLGGAGATVLEWDGDSFYRHQTPGRAADTVFGVWASAPDDIWAVGGRAGRYGFIWHYDGTAWSNLDLPDNIPLTPSGDLPAFFKVWGRAANDVYIVGSYGMFLHFDGTAWSTIATPTRETYFTVAGNADSVYAVGALGSVIDGSGQSVGPSEAPLLQGLWVAKNGEAFLSGQDGALFRGRPGAWTRMTRPDAAAPESIHALWGDNAGSVWAVGGSVLTPALDKGVIYRLGTAVPPLEAAVPVAPPAAVCPEGRVDIAPTASIARRWNELLIDSIRRDIPKPGVHARNLFHSALASWDGWAAYDATADGYLTTEKQSPEDPASAREVAISYAQYRVLSHRYEKAVGGATSLACYRAFMEQLGLDPNDTSATGDTPAALGNRIGAAIIDTFADDGANEASGYADLTGYAPANAPLTVDRAGTICQSPSLWQELNLAEGETQNGIIVEGRQSYIGSNWGFVTSFALGEPDERGVHLDTTIQPTIDDPRMKEWVLGLLRTHAKLSPNEPELRDFSPGAYGNNSLGENDGSGHPLNPISGQPYAPNPEKTGDFFRVLAEFWADGPKSETPPGHWFVLANKVSDQLTDYRLGGTGAPMDRLAWDAHLYFALGGAVHDAAINSWGLKRAYLGPRPITLVRYMAMQGQSSDPAGPSFNALGLPLELGVSELITAESSALGQRHHHLRWWQGEVAVKTWLGEPGDRKNETSGVGWVRAKDWTPYQRRTFVTPAFPGMSSGHSTFSRASAEVLTAITGSPYFPGGFGEFVAPAKDYLVFEDGPSEDVRLQWATYYDAADQAGQSRIWGGIHIWPDDSIGRKTGSEAGIGAYDLATSYFDGTAR